MIAECRPKYGHNTVNKHDDDQYNIPVYRDDSLLQRRNYPYVLFQAKYPVITPIHVPWFTGNNSYTTCEESPTHLSAMSCNMCSVEHRLYPEIRVSLLTKR